jgi:hypothetical protein
LSHALHHALQLGIPDKADQCCSRPAATEKRKLGQMSSRHGVSIIRIFFQPPYWIWSLFVCI